MKRLFLIAAMLVFAVSSLTACQEEGQKKPLVGKKKQHWKTKGTYEVDPKLGKLH